jgi:hypothetical protein
LHPSRIALAAIFPVALRRGCGEDEFAAERLDEQLDSAVIHVECCNLVDTRKGDNNSDGFVDQEKQREWQPIGLLELKPRGCTLNLTVVDGDIAVPGRSVRRTQGKVTVNGNLYP